MTQSEQDALQEAILNAASDLASYLGPGRLTTLAMRCDDLYREHLGTSEPDLRRAGRLATRLREELGANGSPSTSRRPRT
jgi:hypothetical protein